MTHEWSDRYRLGNEAIDEEHKAFFAACQKLYDAVLEGRGEHAVEESLDYLKKYAAEHFRVEEALMRKQGYPRLEEHRKQHLLFLERLEMLADEYAVVKVGSQDFAERVLELTREWLLDHIVEEDTPFERYVEKK